jgi:hypothetical protein
VDALDPDDWRSAAACFGEPIGTFFAPVGPLKNLEAEDDLADVRRCARALRICRGCPVRGACLVEHLTELDGVFGGTTPRQRRDLRRSLGLRSKAAGRVTS